MAETRDGITRRGIVGSVGAALGLASAGPAVGPAPAAADGAGPSRVMIIRHAEKPDRDGAAPFGLDPDGRPDVHALLVRGWERAGALARFFAPRDGVALPAGLARPTFLVAAAATPDHPSRRSGLTLSALAELTGLATDAAFAPDHEAEAAAAILRRDGVGLVAWEHRRIADLVSALTGGTVAGPHWPSHRFDMVLVLDRDGTRWRLTQVPQLLLAGDSPEPLAARGHGAVTPPG